MLLQFGNKLIILPNEILALIMEISGGVTALHSLVCVSGQARRLFEARSDELLLGALHHSEMETQLQILYCNIISIRQHYKHDTANKKLRAYTNERLKDHSTAVNLDLGCTPPSKMIHMLNDAAEIYKSIEEAASSCFSVQLFKMMARLQINLIRDGQPSTVNIKERPQSPTELHRLRRALWRMRLYFEAYHEPYIPLAITEREQMESSGSRITESQDKPIKSLKLSAKDLSLLAKRDHVRTQRRFFSQMTVWELEEMECVWYHLR